MFIDQFIERLKLFVLHHTVRRIAMEHLGHDLGADLTKVFLVVVVGHNGTALPTLEKAVFEHHEEIRVHRALHPWSFTDGALVGGGLWRTFFTKNLLASEAVDRVSCHFLTPAAQESGIKAVSCIAICEHQVIV